MVFRRGICIGSNVWIFFGGHIIPISIVGDNLLWKNAQKKDTKNIISDTINRIIPHLRPFTTFKVWSPWNVLSRTISRHHWYIVNKIIVFPKIRSIIEFLCIHEIIPVIIVIVPIDPVKGQGL